MLEPRFDLEPLEVAEGLQRRGREARGHQEPTEPAPPTDRDRSARCKLNTLIGFIIGFSIGFIITLLLGNVTF